MKKPNTTLSRTIGSVFFTLSAILFLVILHILAINSTGATGVVLLMVFTLTLRILTYLFYIAAMFLIIYFIRWLAYITIHPAWMREEENE